MGATTSTPSDVIISLMLSSARVPVSSASQAGVVMKHVELVSSVTRIATASLPPARRVQTAAEAKVQGATAITISPIASSETSSGEAAQAITGSSSILTAEP